MSQFRIGQAAELLGISADTLRRWADQDRVATTRTNGGQRVIEGAELARFSVELAETPSPEQHSSARNRLPGLVTRVVRDGVMAQVELQAGPHRVVSLMTREAADELGLEPGVLATASVKATTVVIELTP